MAWLTGIVHGVVVQTTACAPTSSGIGRRRSRTRNRSGSRRCPHIRSRPRPARSSRPGTTLPAWAAVELAASANLNNSETIVASAPGHRQVRIVPVGADPEPLQLLALNVDPLLGVSVALGAEFLDRHLVLVELLLAVLLLDLLLDRQPVAVPAGHVGRVLAEHRPGADDDVLERLVDGVADVDVAVGVRRPVVEDELLAAGAGSRTCSYRPLASQRAAIAGSFCGSPAFIGKSVRGRKTVER